MTTQNDLPASQQGPVGTETEDAEAALCDAVRASSLCVGLYDLSASRILALSSSGYAWLGLTGVDLATFDFVEASEDPASVRQLVALISDGHLEAWTSRSLLSVPGGGRVLGYATGRMVGGLGSRLVSLTRFDWRTTPEAEGGAGNRLLEPASDEILIDVRREERRLAARVAGLERHLDRIGQEVGAAGLMSVVSVLPQPSTVPGLAELSARQVEVVTRLLRGERVLTIARRMFLSPSTVRNHLSTIYRKVGVSSQAELLDLLQGARGTDGSA